MSMKKFIIFLSILFTTPSAFSSEPIRGENFQRPRLIDCQSYNIEKLGDIHEDVDIKSCFYEGYYIKDGKEEKVTIEVKVEPYNLFTPDVRLK